MALMTRNYYTSSAGNMYGIEMMNNINGIQFFKISRTCNIKNQVYKNYWLTKEDKICV